MNIQGELFVCDVTVCDVITDHTDRLRELELEIQTLRSENADLRTENADLRNDVETLRDQGGSASSYDPFEAVMEVYEGDLLHVSPFIVWQFKKGEYRNVRNITGNVNIETQSWFELLSFNTY